MGNKQSRWREWKRIESPHAQILCNFDMVQLNLYEFILASRVSKEKSAGLCKYNVHSNKCELLTTYPDYIKDFENAYVLDIIYDKLDNTVHLLIGHDGITMGARCIIYDIKSKQFIKPQFQVPSTTAAMLSIKDEIHLFDMNLNRCRHKIYHKRSRTLAEIDRLSIPADWEISSVNHIVSQDLMLLIAQPQYEEVNNILRILEFSVKIRKWTQIRNIHVGPFRIQQSLVTMDERHLILHAKRQRDILLCMKMSDSNFQKMQLEVPVSHDRHGSWGENIYKFFISGDRNERVIVNGYVRRICERYETHHLSQDIINILCLYYFNEILHCIHCKKYNHQPQFKHYAVSTFNLHQMEFDPDYLRKDGKSWKHWWLL